MDETDGGGVTGESEGKRTEIEWERWCRLHCMWLIEVVRRARDAGGKGAWEARRRSRRSTLVEREAFVRAFSPGSTLESGLKTFRRRGPKWLLETPVTKGGVPTTFSRNGWRRLLAPGTETKGPFSLSW
jgi:hypothetical protein